MNASEGGFDNKFHTNEQTFFQRFSSKSEANEYAQPHTSIVTVLKGLMEYS